MGLAPYGEPTYLDQMREIVHVQSDGTFQLNLRYFRHHTDNVSYNWKDCAPEVGTLFKPALADLLGPSADPGATAGTKTQGYRALRASDVRRGVLRVAQCAVLRNIPPTTSPSPAAAR